MINEPQISLFELVTCLSEATDLVSPALTDHHKQVAYISLCLGKELGLSPENISQLVIAGAFHDIGALSLKERLDALQFELEDPYQHTHAETGYYLLKLFSPLSQIAEVIRFHHVYWNWGKGKQFRGQKVPIESHILHLADRVSVLIDKQREVLSQVSNISEQIENQSGKMFNPGLVEAFTSLANKEFFWLDLVSKSIGSILSNQLSLKTVRLDLDSILDLVNIFSHIIDFRCEFTANHSSGVAACSEKLAALAGLSTLDCRMMKVAGYLHDLGKLAIPVDILNKPSTLTREEFNVVKSHSYYTYRTLESINGFEKINSWASFHHECLDGSGYPFGLGESSLSTGSRIIAVADVFTALMENRPYRAGMDKENALRILQQMVNKGKLDKAIVSMLKLNFEELNLCRLSAQEVIDKEYRRIWKQTEHLHTKLIL